MKKTIISGVILICLIFIISTCNKKRAPALPDLPENTKTPTMILNIYTMTKTPSSTEALTNTNTVTPALTETEIIRLTDTATLTPTTTPTEMIIMTETETPTETMTETNTPTIDITPEIIDVSAQITITACFNLVTVCAADSLAEDKNNFIWVSDSSACAYFHKYDAAGNVLFSKPDMYIYGLASDKVNNKLWYMQRFSSDFRIYSKDADTFSSTGSFKIEMNEGDAYYYGLAYDGEGLWVLATNTYYNIWKCYKYSTNGDLLTEFNIPKIKMNSPVTRDITYGDGYLWIPNRDNNFSYIYKISTNGRLETIYILGNTLMDFDAIEWVDTNTFLVIVIKNFQCCRLNF